MMQVVRKLAVLTVGMLVACGGDDSLSTVPPPPLQDQDAACAEIDHGSDGTLDEVETYMYDADGFVVRIESTDNVVQEYAYDDLHFLLNRTYDQGGDGTPEIENTYTRDSDGRPLSYEQRSNGEVAYSYVTTYDSAGRTKRTVVTQTAHGQTFTDSWDYKYSGDHIVPTEILVTGDTGSTRYTYMSSSDARMVHIDADVGDNRSIDTTIDWTYGPELRPLTMDSVTHNGVNVTSRTSVTYNARGSQLTNVFADNDVLQPDDYVQTDEYTDAGMRTKETVESPSGDQKDYVYTKTFKQTCATPRR